MKYSKLFVSAALLLIASGCSATTYYTSTNGSDSNNGSINTPFKTLSKGVSVLTPGDTLYIRSGTYYESLENNIPGGTSWQTPVTVSGYPGETVTLRPSGNRVIEFTGSTKKYIVIDNLILDASSASIDAVKLSASSVNLDTGIITNPPGPIRFKNSEIKNAKGQGFLVIGDGNEFINLKVHNNGTTDHDHGFYISSSNNLIENCEIYNNAGWGIQIYTGSDAIRANSNVIRNNKVHDNAAAQTLAPGMTYVRGVGIGLYNGDNNIAYNNVIWNNSTGIAVNYSSSNIKVFNNTLYSNRKNVSWASNIEIGSGAYNARVQNNIMWGPGGTINDSGAGTVKDHNITTDPRFMTPGTDFRLQPNSPAIDAGISLSEVNNDISGQTRPKGSGYDIGAYEYLATVTPPITPPPVIPPVTNVYPSAITDLKILETTQRTVTLSWTPPQDIFSYEIRLSTSNITSSNWGSAVRIGNEPAPLSGTQTFTIGNLTINVVYYFAIKSKNSSNNLSPISNVVSTKIGASQTVNQTLSAGISAPVEQGLAPLTIVITGESLGAATGNANYTFYCNRADSGINITQGYDGKYDNVSASKQTHTCTYQTPGTYNAKVIIEKGSLQAEARRTIIATSPSSNTQISNQPVIIVFITPMYLGMTSNDVKNLQTFLAQDKIIYPEGKITGYYGLLTFNAVGRFQEKYSIVFKGQPGYGRVGPKTLTKLNELNRSADQLKAQIELLQRQLLELRNQLY